RAPRGAVRRHRLPAAGAVPRAGANPRAHRRRVPRLPATTARRRHDHAACVDRTALRAARTAVRPAHRPRHRLLRFPSRLNTEVLRMTTATAATTDRVLTDRTRD